jgi:hypothetical protein
VNISPVLTPGSILIGGALDAFLEISTCALRSETFSRTITAVIIFTVEAGYIILSAFFEYNISPVPVFKIIAASAVISGGFSSPSIFMPINIAGASAGSDAPAGTAKAAAEISAASRAGKTRRSILLNI